MILTDSYNYIPYKSLHMKKDEVFHIDQTDLLIMPFCNEKHLLLTTEQSVNITALFDI